MLAGKVVNFEHIQRFNPCHAIGLFLYPLKTFPSYNSQGVICSKSIDRFLYDENIGLNPFYLVHCYISYKNQWFV